RRTILEHVTEVRIATSARHGRAPHPETQIRTLDDVRLRDRLPEAGPPGVRVELRSRIEERGIATDAAIDSGRFVLVVFAAVWWLCAFVPRHSIRLGRELLTPLLVRSHDSVDVDLPETLTVPREVFDRHRAGGRLRRGVRARRDRKRDTACDRSRQKAAT